MKYYIISLISTLLLSCNSSKQQSRDFLGSISKNPCPKSCEVYDLHIYSDGTFVYIGGINSVIKGTHEGKLSKKELFKINRLFQGLPKNDSYVKGKDISTITVKYNNTITIHEFGNPIFLGFYNFVEELYDRII